MLLSKRMNALAELVKAQGVLADVGCDHGYISIELINQGKALKAIALDVAKGPLDCAERNIRNAKMVDLIELRLSDGFEKLEPGEADSILIAGMGGPTICSILTAKPEVAAAAKELILQPQSEIFEFRQFLMENRFILMDEDIVIEDNKIYPMMRVRKAADDEEIPAYSVLELEYGPLLLERKHPVLNKLLRRDLKKNNMILQQLKLQGQSDMVRERIAEVEGLIERISTALDSF